jgi:hypothetical protein
VALDTTPKPAESIDGLPSGDLPVHATAAVVAVPGRRTAEVIIATRVGAPGGSSERTIELSAVAIDLGAKLRGQETMLDVENFSAARSADYQVATTGAAVGGEVPIGGRGTISGSPRSESGTIYSSMTIAV